MTKTTETAASGTIFLYTTFPDAATAEAVGTGLVDQRLAACVNVLPGMRSVYRWNGVVERADEVVMIVKTLAEREGEAIAAIKAAHPYEIPAIVTLPAAGGLPAYLDWIAENSRDRALPNSR